LFFAHIHSNYKSLIIIKPLRNNRRQFIKDLSLAVIGTSALTKSSFALNTPFGIRPPRASGIIKSSPVQIYQLPEKAVTRQEEQGKDPGEACYAYLNRYRERAEKAKGFFRKIQRETFNFQPGTLIVVSLPAYSC